MGRDGLKKILYLEIHRFAGEGVTTMRKYFDNGMLKTISLS